MKSNNIDIRLAAIITPLALFATGAGVFWQGKGKAYPFETLCGETIMIRDRGLYRYDTVNSSSQEIGTDIVTMIIGQVGSGVPVDVVVSMIFFTISMSRIILGIITLKNFRG